MTSTDHGADAGSAMGIAKLVSFRIGRIAIIGCRGPANLRLPIGSALCSTIGRDTLTPSTAASVVPLPAEEFAAPQQTWSNAVTSGSYERRILYGKESLPEVFDFRAGWWTFRSIFAGGVAAESAACEGVA